MARGQRAITKGTYPEQSLTQMEEDMDATLPALHLFHRETGAMRQDLRDLMIADLGLTIEKAGLGFA